MLKELRPRFSGWLAPSAIDRFPKDLDELFDRFFDGIADRDPMASMAKLPAIKSFVKDGQLVVRVDLPGVDPKAIDVSVAGDTLTIRASREQHNDERKQGYELREVTYGGFERSIVLPEGVKSDQIKANYRNGVLELTMPAPQSTGRRIPVELGAEEKKQLEPQAAA
jgi:HSP20 family protein